MNTSSEPKETPVYIENAPEIETNEFIKVVTSRRSVRIYEDSPIPQQIVRDCLENALLAPNSSNLQPWEFYWVKSSAKKSELIKICLSQSAARTAAELFVIVAHPKRWKKHAREMKQIYASYETPTGRKLVTYYQIIVPLLYGLGFLGLLGPVKKLYAFFLGLKKPMIRESTSKEDIKLWAVKSTALAAENLMLSFRAYGFDTCPMEGFDSKRIKKLLDLPKDSIVLMVISAGKRAEGGINTPRIRFDSSRFIQEV